MIKSGAGENEASQATPAEVCYEIANGEDRAQEPRFHYDAELDISYKVGPGATVDTPMPTPTPSVQHGCKRTSRGEKSSSIGKLANTNGSPAHRNGISVFSHRTSQGVKAKRKQSVAIERGSVPSHRSTHSVARVDVNILDVTSADHGIGEDQAMLDIVKFYEGVICAHVHAHIREHVFLINLL